MSTLTGKILADFTTSLATTMAVGATTATLQSATDDDGVALPSGRYYFTLDGSNSSKEHIRCTLSDTSLTDIYSVSRQGVATSGTVRAHRLGATVTLTDFAHIKVINDLINGTTNLDSSNPLSYDGTASISSANQIATKAYVDGVAIAAGANASSTVKGISKLSVDPVSATNPIAVGDNDTRVPTQSENDALAGTSGTPSSSNKYVTNDDTTGTGSIPRASALSYGFFGNGNDGDVTISSNTSLTRDMYYNNLTISTGFTLTSASYRIFVKDTLTIEGTGSIVNNGNAGTVGSNGTTVQYGGGGGGGGGGGASGGIVAIFAKTIVVGASASLKALGGTGGAGGNGASGGNTFTGLGGVGGAGGAGGIAVSAGSLSAGVAGVAGSNGGGGGGSNAAGSAGANSTAASTLANSIGSAASTSVGVLGGTGGTGGSYIGGNGGTGVVGGAVTNPIMMPYYIPFAINLFTTDPSAATPVFVKTSNGSNGGPGGGGGGATQGGSAGAGGGGGGGNGGSGGVIVLVYKTLTNSGSISVAGGAGGAAGTGGTGATAGATGATGVVYQLTV